MDHERGLRLLLRGLRDEDTWIRRAAVNQLLLSRDGRDIPALLARLDDPDPTVANLTTGALRHQTKKPFYASVLASPAQKRAATAQWRQWWRGAGRSRFPPDPALVSLGPLRPQRTDPAPDFSLSDLDGKPLRLADQRGRVTLLNFWGSWCPPCQKEIPRPGSPGRGLSRGGPGHRRCGFGREKRSVASDLVPGAWHRLQAGSGDRAGAAGLRQRRGSPGIGSDRPTRAHPLPLGQRKGFRNLPRRSRASARGTEGRDD